MEAKSVGSGSAKEDKLEKEERAEEGNDDSSSVIEGFMDLTLVRRRRERREAEEATKRAALYMLTVSGNSVWAVAGECVLDCPSLFCNKLYTVGLCRLCLRSQRRTTANVGVPMRCSHHLVVLCFLPFSLD